MKFTITILFLLSISFSAFAQLPEFMWADQCGNPPNTSDTKTSLTAGLAGEFYLSGEFLDTVKFGSKDLVSSGGTDIFLVKHTAEGDPVWSLRIGGADYDYNQKVLTDVAGNVILAGYFYGTTQIGPDQYVSYGSQDLFVAKYNAAGEFAWSFRAGGPMADYLSGLSSDNEGNIIISGYFYDEMDFGDTTVLSTRSSDIFLAKFSPDGELQWVNTAGGSSSDQARSVACDTENNILMTGSFYFDITLGDTMITTANPVGNITAKYQADGQLVKVFQLEGSYLTTEIYVADGQNGDFYISGNFSEEIVFGSTVFDAGEFNQDLYLAKYNSNCDFQWASHGHSIASDQVIDMVTDNYGNVYLTGHYLDTIHFETLTLPYTLCCGSREVFIAGYSADGEVLWGDQITGTRANVQAMAMNYNNELLFSGMFTEEVNFGPYLLSHFEGFKNYLSCLQTEVFTNTGKDYKKDVVGIYPNPATEWIKITTPGHKSPGNYKIYNSGGSLLLTGSLDNDGFIDVRPLPSGIYLIRLEGNESIDPGNSLFIIK